MTTDCPKCTKHSVLHGFKTGRATCNLCIECGWCVTHGKYWPSVVNYKAKMPA